VEDVTPEIQLDLVAIKVELLKVLQVRAGFWLILSQNTAPVAILV
jgi:hypothetical protein